MSDNVVQISPGKPKIWVCSCGCSTFELLSDGYARCAACGNESIDEGDGWFSLIEDGEDRDPDLDNPTRDIQGNGSVEFARRRLQVISQGDDVVGIVAMRKCGSIHCWGDVTTSEQLRWFEERLVYARRMIRSFFEEKD